MNLSTAIRKGAEQRPQAFGRFITEFPQSSCALAAAHEGLTGEPWDNLLGVRVYVLREAFPVLLQWVECPVCGSHGSGRQREMVEYLVLHLNDTHRWTRERIADWIETIEGP